MEAMHPRGRRALAALLVACGVALLACAGCSSAPAPDGRGWGFSDTTTLPDLQATLLIDQTSTEAASLEVQLQDAAGGPVELDTLPVRLTLTELDAAVQEVVAKPLGAGSYRYEGKLFPLAGRWLLEAQVARSPDAPEVAAFALVVAPPGEAPQPLLRADEQSLQVGANLYAERCAGCHGPVGLGDGSDLGPGAEPLPALPDRMRVGVRSDGQLFAWTHDGISGTSMPGYGLVLGDTEIWQLVAYLRGLGAASAPQATRVPPQATPRPAQVVREAPETLPPLIFVGVGEIWRSDGIAEPQPLFDLDELQVAEDPAVSPDGKTIAFVMLNLPDGQQQAEVSWSLYLVTSDGTGLRPLGAPSTDELRSPAWAADGGALYVGVVGAGEQASYSVAEVDLASGDRRTLIQDATDPTTSDDGRMAYLRIDPQSFATSIVVAGPGGASPQTILEDPRFALISAPRLSRDGTRIVFAASEGPPTDDQGIPLAGRPASPLATLAGWLLPSAEAHGAPQDLWSIGADGSGLRRLTTRYEDEPRATYSPDGAEILWMSYSGIYRMDADGANMRRISALGDHGGLDWVR
jgi:mono/diheme cytochrome c family protein